jgi:hypothetical protein
MPNGRSIEERPPRAEVILQMAALILAVRTVRFEDKEFQGMGSPRFRAQLANSISAAESLFKRACESRPEWF